MSVTTDKWIDSHSDQLIEALRECVMIKSVRDDSTAKAGAPFGEGSAKCLESTLSHARSLGFDVKNLDGYCGCIDFGEGEEQLGILAHLDVVPEGEGWQYPPYAGEIHSGKLYGRGTMDDKGPAFAALYGLAAVKASGLKTRRRVRIILGCDEECGMECLNHYAKVEKQPDLSFSPDAEYPLVNSEKLIYNSSYKREYASAVKVKAGTVSNAVPGSAYVFVPVSRNDVEKAISSIGDSPFKYEVSEENGGCSIKVTGVAAHASTPEYGKNAFLAAVELMDKLPLAAEDKLSVHGLSEILSFDCHGESFGIDSRDESGRLTTNVGVVEWDETGIKRLTMDIRAPISADGELITAKLAEGFKKAGLEEIEHGWSEGYYVSPESELVSKLIGVYNKRFNKDAKPMAIGGGTYARHLKNAVAFGMERPGEPVSIHMANECIRLDHLIEDAKVMADAIIALACEE